jgi:hypothetical protein
MSREMIAKKVRRFDESAPQFCRRHSASFSAPRLVSFPMPRTAANDRVNAAA